MSKSRVAIAVLPRFINPQTVERMYYAGAIVVGVALALNCLSIVDAFMRFVPLLGDEAGHGLAVYTFSEIVALSLICAVLHMFRRKIISAAKELADA